MSCNYTRQKAHVNTVCEMKRTFVPSRSRVRRQWLYFHVVCKTWSILKKLSSIFSFRKTRWRQLTFSENRNKQCNQSKFIFIHKDYVKIFLVAASDSRTKITEIVETNKEGCNSSLFGCRMKTAKGNRIKIYFCHQTRSRYYWVPAHRMLHAARPASSGSCGFQPQPQSPQTNPFNDK